MAKAGREKPRKRQVRAIFLEKLASNGKNFHFLCAVIRVRILFAMWNSVPNNGLRQMADGATGLAQRVL